MKTINNKNQNYSMQRIRFYSQIHQDKIRTQINNKIQIRITKYPETKQFGKRKTQHYILLDLTFI